MTVLVVDYQKHVNLLAQLLKCQIVQQEKMPGMMYVEFGYVEGPIIRKQSDYLTMLHELGHFAYGHTQGRPPHQSKRFYFDNGVLHSEAQAWEWALDNCIDIPTEDSRRFMWDKCLGSYYQIGYQNAAGRPDRLMNGDRAYVTFTYDDPDSYFEAVTARIQAHLKGFRIKYTGKLVSIGP